MQCFVYIQKCIHVHFPHFSAENMGGILNLADDVRQVVSQNHIGN